MMEYAKFLDKWAEYHSHVRLYLRVGQSIMNYIHANHRDIYDEITGTENDCFYDDTKILETLKYVKNRLETKNI